MALKLLACFKNSKNNSQRQKVDDWKATCQAIKAGVLLLVDGKENWSLKHSRYKDEILKISGSEQLTTCTVHVGPYAQFFLSSCHLG